MTYKVFPLPNFGELSGAQLIEAYNELNEGTDAKVRRAPFPSKEEGLARCQGAWRAWAKENPETPEAKAARIEAAKEAKAKEREERRAAAEATKAEQKSKKASEPRAEKKAGSERGLDGTIKILTKDDENPYRAGTISEKMFEVMREHPLVSDYIDHAVEHSRVAEENRRRDARLWLSNAVRSGYVSIEVGGGDERGTPG